MPRLQYMPINDFDRGLVEKFETHDYEYNPANWNRLTQSLPESRNSRVKRYIWLPLSGIAAAIALLIGVPMLMQKGDSHNTIANHKKVITAPAAQTTPSVGVVAPQARTIVAPSEDLQVQPANHQRTSSYTAHSTNNQSNNIPLTRQAQNRPSFNTPANQQSLATIQQPVLSPVIENERQLPVTENEHPVILPAESQPVIVRNNIPTTQLRQEPVAHTVPKTATAMMIEGVQTVDNSTSLGVDPDNIGFQKNKKASLSLTGGYNQGTINTGYAVGVNTRKNLGDKLYLEGDIAFSSARNTQQTLSMETEMFDTYLATAPSNFVLSPKGSYTSPVANMYYLQVTPVVGFQVVKNVSLGAGADVQRMFRDNDNTIFVANGEAPKPVPRMDYGLVGKTEYTLFRTLKAGVQYRYGMNSVLAPEKNYLNRSYLQVQLKLGILGSTR